MRETLDAQVLVLQKREILHPARIRQVDENSHALSGLWSKDGAEQTRQAKRRKMTLIHESTLHKVAKISKGRFGEFSRGEPATLGVADGSRQIHRRREIASHFPWRVGVGAESDGNAPPRRQFQEGAAGINLPAILAQAGGIQLDGDVGLGRAIQEPLEQRRTILRWDKF